VGGGKRSARRTEFIPLEGGNGMNSVLRRGPMTEAAHTPSLWVAVPAPTQEIVLCTQNHIRVQNSRVQLVARFFLLAGSSFSKNSRGGKDVEPWAGVFQVNRDPQTVKQSRKFYIASGPVRHEPAAKQGTQLPASLALRNSKQNKKSTIPGRVAYNKKPVKPAQ